MNDSEPRRRFPRVNVDEDHRVLFQIGDRTASDVVITNLSAGGCCVKLACAQADGLDKGTVIPTLTLVHPRMPSEPLQAMICWMLGKQPGRVDGFILVGFEFTNADPHVQATLDAYVKELLG